VAAKSQRATARKGIALTPLRARAHGDAIEYSAVSVAVQRASGSPPSRCAARAPAAESRRRWRRLAPTSGRCALARELDDAILDIRSTSSTTAAIVFKSSGDAEQVLAYDAFLDANKDTGWRARSRITGSACSSASISPRARWWPGRAGLLLCRHACRARVRDRPLLHADRPARRRQQAAAAMALARANFGAYPMSNGLTRLASRFLANPAEVESRKGEMRRTLDAETAEQMGLVTFALDDIDWDDEVRVFLEERASFSPDGLTGLEANLRFGGPETMESKIFARLTAWQNWIFQRPNAVGEEGALKRYGTGQKRRSNEGCDATDLPCEGCACHLPIPSKRRGRRARRREP
jgi:benzoyl-CoA-dihydrodiol lyase